MLVVAATLGGIKEEARNDPAMVVAGADRVWELAQDFFLFGRGQGSVRDGFRDGIRGGAGCERGDGTSRTYGAASRCLFRHARWVAEKRPIGEVEVVNFDEQNTVTANKCILTFALNFIKFDQPSK